MTADDYFRHIVFRRTENIFQTSKGTDYNLAGRPAQEAVKQEVGNAKSSTGRKTILVGQRSLIASIPGKVLAFVCGCHREKRRHRAVQSISPIFTNPQVRFLIIFQGLSL